MATVYNYPGLFSEMFSRISCTLGKYICSMFVFIGYVEGGMEPKYSVKDNVVVDQEGKPVPGPVPGEMTTRFPCWFGETKQVRI